MKSFKIILMMQIWHVIFNQIL